MRRRRRWLAASGGRRLRGGELLIAEIGHRDERADAAGEKHLGFVDVAETGEHALVQQRVGDRNGGRSRSRLMASARSKLLPRRSGPSRDSASCRARSLSAMNSATGMLKPTASKSAVASTMRMSRERAATVPPGDRCASCRSSACACAGRARRRNASAGACRPTRPCRSSSPSTGDRRGLASVPETPIRTGRRGVRRARGAASRGAEDRVALRHQRFTDGAKSVMRRGQIRSDGSGIPSPTG